MIIDDIPSTPIAAIRQIINELYNRRAEIEELRKPVTKRATQLMEEMCKVDELIETYRDWMKGLGHG